MRQKSDKGPKNYICISCQFSTPDMSVAAVHMQVKGHIVGIVIEHVEGIEDAAASDNSEG